LTKSARTANRYRNPNDKQYELNDEQERAAAHDERPDTFRRIQDARHWHYGLSRNPPPLSSYYDDSVNGPEALVVLVPVGAILVPAHP